MKNPIKKLTALVLTLACILSMAMLPIHAAEAVIGYDASKVVAKSGINTLADIKSGLTTAKEYKITDPSGFAKLAEIVNGGNALSGYTFYLANDINFSGVTNYAPIGVTVTSGVYGVANNGNAVPDYYFGGTFDGQGYAIKNWVIDGKSNVYNRLGLFGNLYKATVKNLIVDESCQIVNYTNAGNTFVGFVAAIVHDTSTFSNISVRGTMNTVNATWLGGVIGYTYGHSGIGFENCEFMGDLLSMKVNRLGGFIGQTNWNWKKDSVLASPLTVTNCRIAADISNDKAVSVYFTGGFTGTISGLLQGVFTKCITNSNISGYGAITGGFVGNTASGGLNLKFIDCSNYGTVSSNCPYIGQVTNAISDSLLEGSGLTINGTVYAAGKANPIEAGTSGAAFGSFAAGADTTLAVSAKLAKIGVGIQVSKGTTLQSISTNVRLLSAIDSTDYDSVGFSVKLKKTNGTLSQAKEYLTTTVYSSIIANDETIENPEEKFGVYGKYFHTLTITDVPSADFGMTLYVKPIAVQNGVKYYGEEKSIVLSTIFENEEITPMTANVTNRVITVSGTHKETVTFQKADGSGTFNQELTYRYNAWPTVVSDENGVLYAVGSVRVAHVDPFGKSVLFKSTDGGATWTKAVTVNDSIRDEGTYKDYRDTGLVYLGNGRMVMSSFFPSSANLINSASEYGAWMSGYSSYGITEEVVNSVKAKLQAQPYNSDSYLRYSNDYGQTWSEPISVGLGATTPHGEALYINGDLFTVMGNGDKIYKRLYDVSYDTNGNITGITFDSHVTIRTLADLGLGSLSSGYRLCESHTTVLHSGRILVATRVNRPDLNSSNQYLNLLISYSDDGGVNWTHKWAVDQSGNTFEGAPGHLLQLDNGAIIMSYSKRQGVYGEFARISYDGGLTWSAAITLNQEGGSAQKGDLGYPSTAVVKKEGGTYYLATVYYQRPDNAVFGITELQCTTWTLK